MRAINLMSKVLVIKDTRVTEVSFEQDEVVVDVALTSASPRCSGCGQEVRDLYDHYSGRRWRHLDIAGKKLWLRYNIRRVDCPQCGVRVEQVPWAATGVYFTFQFEEQVGFLAQHMDKGSISQLLRIAWDTVGKIIQRVEERKSHSPKPS